MRRKSAVFLGAVAVAMVAGFGHESVRAQGKPAFTLPKGLQDQPMEVPPDNPITAGKIKLGEQLFFDKRLSKTKAMSCETCHVPEKGWTDGLKLSPKFDGSVNTRHSPTLYGVAYYPDLYWDGRAKGLEAQILAAWKSQMGADPDLVAKELEPISGYASQFKAEFGGGPTGDSIVKALASFVRTIHAGDTPYDRGSAGPAAKQGFEVFSKTASCTLCHLPPLYSDGLFHNVGIGFDAASPDAGRGKILADAAAKANQPAPSEAEKLKGAFKTPSLRGVALTGPYFHDGRAATLEEAVDLMLKGGIPNPQLDEKLKPAQLKPKERRQLLAFLKSLTPEEKPYPRPKLP